jgi:high-affinity nickel-transport protein
VLDAFALGARHGFDADHLAAISELTASQRGGVLGFVAGIRYALGHAVSVAAIGFAAGEAGLDVPGWVIGATLVGLGLWAAVRLLRGHTHGHEHAHGIEVVHHSHRHRHGGAHAHAVGIGLVHGLGGAPSAVLAGSRGGLALATFAVGLLLANGMVGAIAGVSTKVALLAWVGVAGGVTYGTALMVGVA